MPHADPIPHGYCSITPYINVQNVAEYIKFLENAFDATKLYSIDGEDGVIGHAEVRIGNSIVMLGSAKAEAQTSSCGFYLYVSECDKVYQHALDAGCSAVQPLTDHFYGDRSGGVKDPVGNTWWIATHTEDLNPGEMHRRSSLARK